MNDLLAICDVSLVKSTFFITGSTIKVGDKVRVKPSVTMPTYKWGSVNHRSIGTVTGLSLMLIFYFDQILTIMSDQFMCGLPLNSSTVY